MDLTTMSVSELKKLETRVAREISRRKEVTKRSLLKEIKKLAEAKGLSLNEIMKEAEATLPGRKRGPAKRKNAAGAKPGGKLPAKYRNPANPEQGWSGHGRRPQWVLDHLAAGKPLEDLAIEKQTTA